MTGMEARRALQAEQEGIGLPEEEGEAGVGSSVQCQNSVCPCVVLAIRAGIKDIETGMYSKYGGLETVVHDISKGGCPTAVYGHGGGVMVLKCWTCVKPGLGSLEPGLEDLEQGFGGVGHAVLTADNVLHATLLSLAPSSVVWVSGPHHILMCAHTCSHANFLNPGHPGPKLWHLLIVWISNKLASSDRLS